MYRLFDSIFANLDIVARDTVGKIWTLLPLKANLLDSFSRLCLLCFCVVLTEIRRRANSEWLGFRLYRDLIPLDREKSCSER